MKRSTRIALAIACAMALLVTACGDDDDDDDVASAPGGEGEEAAGGDLDAYCDLIVELDNQDGPPTVEQMTEIKELRPDEIGEEIDLVADAFIEADGDVGAVFSDPEVEAQFEVIDAHDAEHCPESDAAKGDDEGEGEGEVTAGYEDFCAELAVVNGQDGPPTMEQVQAVSDVAPDELTEAFEALLGALEAADGDMDAAFSDPETGAAIGEIEAAEAEHCGGGDSEEDGDLEAAEGATVVPVTAVDFAFEDVPETVAAGPVAFEFTNDGESIHEAVLFALDGKTPEELIADAEAAFEADEEGDIGEMGFAFSAPGGDPRYINADLEAGEYVFICFIPGPEGKAHYELGMQQTVTVG